MSEFETAVALDPMKTVLVVDDDAMVRSILIEYLQLFGFVNIIDGKSGRNTLKLLNDPKFHVDLVLADWQMPEVDGISLLKLTKQLPNRKGAKFIMITSQGPEERIKVSRAKQAGVDAYIVKPFRGALLKEKIWKVFGWPIDGGGQKDDIDEIL